MMLSGRTVLVTGAGGGVGRDIVLACAREGARVLLSDHDETRGKASLAALFDAGGEGAFLPADLGDPVSIETMVERIEGPLHGLVNNGAIATGIGGIGFEDITIDRFDEVMRVNVRGTWLMVRACAPALAASGAGRIVNLASDTALWGAPNLLSYVASKGAVMAMTRSLARELGPRQIGVTAVAPGILTTDSTHYVPRERHALYETMRAVPGPQDARSVADVVTFLLSPAALTLTGQTLAADNGFVFT